MAAFRVYENELIDADAQDANRVAFRAFTLERFIDALAEAGADDLARDLWGRYCDFERVYHLALGEYLEKPSGHATAAPIIPPSFKDVGTSLQKAATSATDKRATKSRAQKAAGVRQ